MTPDVLFCDKKYIYTENIGSSVYNSAWAVEV